MSINIEFMRLTFKKRKDVPTLTDFTAGTFEKIPCTYCAGLDNILSDIVCPEESMSNAAYYDITGEMIHQAIRTFLSNKKTQEGEVSNDTEVKWKRWLKDNDIKNSDEDYYFVSVWW